MKYVKWGFLTVLLLAIIAFLHYTLPQRDIVRINGTEVIRTDFSGWNRVFFASPDSGGADNQNRDLRIINTVYPNGKVMVFRNEDTGFGWPPYFKFNSSNIQAKAEDLVSKRDNPVWVAVTHYGWRNEFWSIYPNVIALREVEGPDVQLFPWLNIVILLVIGLLLLGVWRLLQRMKRRLIDPIFARLEARREAAELRRAREKANEAASSRAETPRRPWQR